MTQFAKFIDTDTIRRPPRHLKSSTLVAFNFDQNETLLREQGYLPLQYDEQDNEIRQGYYWKPQYELVEDIQTITTQEEDEEGYMVDVNTRVDNSYIQVHWVETIQEEEVSE